MILRHTSEQMGRGGGGNKTALEQCRCGIVPLVHVLTAAAAAALRVARAWRSRALAMHIPAAGQQLPTARLVASVKVAYAPMQRLGPGRTTHTSCRHLQSGVHGCEICFMRAKQATAAADHQQHVGMHASAYAQACVAASSSAPHEQFVRAPHACSCICNALEHILRLQLQGYPHILEVPDDHNLLWYPSRTKLEQAPGSHVGSDA